MMKYYFIPYAGGSLATFNHWKKLFAPEIEFTVMELPGHGRRIFEDCIEDFQEAIDGLYQALREQITEGTEVYALGGHCLGAVLAAELVFEIQRKNEIPLPKGIIISGHGSPSYVEQKEKISKKSELEITEILKRDGGFSVESLQPEILELLIPVIRSDASLYESYRYTKKELPVDVAILYGRNDPKTPFHEVKEWEELIGTDKEIQFFAFDTDHYFILKESDKYIETVQRFLERR